MPPLDNQRHERFCQALVQGRSAAAAYREAGYAGSNTANASRLKQTAAIRQRVAELTAEAAKAHEITLEGVLRDLDEAVQTARSKGHATAMVSASALKSRLGGLLIDRSQVEINENRNEYADCSSFPEVANKLAADQLGDLVNSRWLPIDESDHAYLAEMWLEHFTQVRKFLDSVEARPLLKSGMTLLTERDVIKPSK